MINALFNNKFNNKFHCQFHNKQSKTQQGLFLFALAGSLYLPAAHEATAR